MSTAPGTDFWICLYGVGVLLLGLCFLSGFSANVMVACCLFSWPVQLVCSQGMPADVGSWDTDMSWVKEGLEEKVFAIH